MDNTVNTGFGFSADQTGGGRIAIWQNPQEMQSDLSGANVLNPPLANCMIPAGTSVEFDAAAMTAKICYRLEIYEDAGAAVLEYKVKKVFGITYKIMAKVGMNIMKMPATLVATGAAYPITEIDTSNALYDIVKFGTTLGAVTAGDVLAEGNGTAATGIALEAVANRLVKDQVYVQDDSFTHTVTTVFLGMIYSRRIFPVPAIEQANMAQINFSPLK